MTVLLGGVPGPFSESATRCPSGEAAIATWGFQGTLQQLMEYTGGSATRMAELFQNVRGLAGVLRIAGEGAKAYNEGIDKLHISQENLNKIFKEFT